MIYLAAQNQTFVQTYYDKTIEFNVDALEMVTKIVNMLMVKIDTGIF